MNRDPRPPLAPLLAAVLLACLALVPAAAAPLGDAAAWLYDSAKVVQIALSIPSASRDALEVDPYTYVDATFTLTDAATTYGPWAVKLKLKGRLGSFRSLEGKSAFKLKFPSSARRVSGLKKMTLNNMVQDPSSLHEVLAYDLFRAMDVAAPRTGYAVVTVDGVDYGLHLNVETLDDVSLPNWYGAANTTHLYEGTYGVWSNPLDAFDDHYEVDEGDEADRTDLTALIAASLTEGEGWRAAVEAVADLEQMTRMWAVERFIGHWDGYSNWIINNYYLHSDAAGYFTMLPWGVDQVFSTRLDFGDDTAGVLFSRCFVDPVGREMYMAALRDVRDAAASLDLASKAATLFDSLTEVIEADTRKEYDLEWATAVKDETIRFLGERPAELARWLAVEARSLWDLTGLYETELGGAPLRLDVVHHTTGAISGEATLQLSTAEAIVPVRLTVRGNATGSNGILRSRLTLRNADAADPVKALLAFDLTLDAEARQFAGPVVGSIRIGTVTRPLPDSVLLPLPATVVGTWTLQFDLKHGARGVTGTALLRLSGGMDHLFRATGRTVGGLLNLTLAGHPSDAAARAIMIRTTVSPLESGGYRIEAFSGKGYGQTLAW